MSRVGRKIITIPSGVRVEVTDENGKRFVSVAGPKDTLRQEISTTVSVEINDGKIEVKRANDEAQNRAMHGLYNRLIQNMVDGVTQGFKKTLILNGVGYKAAMKGADLVLNLGFSHPSEVKAEKGITYKILTPAEIQTLNLGKDGIGVVLQVSGADKERVGAVASRIRDIRPVEPYHMYGVRYHDEHVIRKESKSGKKK